MPIIFSVEFEAVCELNFFVRVERDFSVEVDDFFLPIKNGGVGSYRDAFFVFKFDGAGVVFIDSKHIKASANKHKSKEVRVTKPIKQYQQELEAQSKHDGFGQWTIYKRRT